MHENFLKFFKKLCCQHKTFGKFNDIIRIMKRNADYEVYKNVFMEECVLMYEATEKGLF